MTIISKPVYSSFEYASNIVLYEFRQKKFAKTPTHFSINFKSKVAYNLDNEAIYDSCID